VTLPGNPIPHTAPSKGFRRLHHTGERSPDRLDEKQVLDSTKAASAALQRRWSAANGAIWDLPAASTFLMGGPRMRRLTHLSWAGAVRRGGAGVIHHAFRMTVAHTPKAMRTEVTCRSCHMEREHFG